jgi:hypothetical protein
LRGLREPRDDVARVDDRGAGWQSKAELEEDLVEDVEPVRPRVEVGEVAPREVPEDVGGRRALEQPDPVLRVLGDLREGQQREHLLDALPLDPDGASPGAKLRRPEVALTEAHGPALLQLLAVHRVGVWRRM